MPTWPERVLNQQFPIRYWALMLAATGAFAVRHDLGGLRPGMWICWLVPPWSCWGCATCGRPRRPSGATTPIVSRLRYLLEFIRPEIRQYFIESDAEARAFRGTAKPGHQRAKGRSDKRPSAARSTCMSKVMSGSTIPWCPPTWLFGFPRDRGRRAGAALCAQRLQTSRP